MPTATDVDCVPPDPMVGYAACPGPQVPSNPHCSGRARRSRDRIDRSERAGPVQRGRPAELVADGDHRLVDRAVRRRDELHAFRTEIADIADVGVPLLDVGDRIDLEVAVVAVLDEPRGRRVRNVVDDEARDAFETDERIERSPTRPTSTPSGSGPFDMLRENGAFVSTGRNVLSSRITVAFVS